MSSTNGHAPTLEEIREQIEYHRARAELAQLQEASDFWDISRRFQDIEPHGWQRLGPWLPFDRARHQDGQNAPWVWNETDLDRIRGFANDLATENHIAVGILEHLVNYTISTGFEYQAVPEKRYEDDQTAKELAEQVQEVVDEFIDLNAWGEREREACFRRSVDGEVLLRSFRQHDHTTLTRFVECEQLRQPLGSPHNYRFGIETHPKDIELALNYAITYDPTDPSDYEEVPACEVTHIKANVRSTIKRGLSDFYCTREAIDGVKKLLRGMQIGGAIQASIPWIEQFEGATKAAVSGNVMQQRDSGRTYLEDPITGKTSNLQRFEPGMIPKIGAGRTYIPAPLASNTTQHISIVQACLRAVGNRWGMPEYLVSGDASNANYASTLVSGAPFVRAVECRQAMFKRYFLRVLWIAIGNAADARRFYVGSRRITADEVMHFCDVHATPPQVPISDKTAESQVDQADLTAGVISIPERQRRRGVDPDLMAKEIKEHPPTRVSGKATDVDPQGNPVEGDQGGNGQEGGNGQTASPFPRLAHPA